MIYTPTKNDHSLIWPRNLSQRPPSSRQQPSNPYFLPTSTMASYDNMESNELCRAFRNNGKCRYGDDCKYEHSEGEPVANPPRGPCFNFEKDGECSFGERCRFKHGEDDPRFDMDGNKIPTKGKKKNRKSRARNSDEPREKLDEVCNNYMEGRCRYGDNCRRQHPGNVEQEPVEKIDEICNNFLEGRCRFGDLSRRVHE